MVKILEFTKKFKENYADLSKTIKQTFGEKPNLLLRIFFTHHLIYTSIKQTNKQQCMKHMQPSLIDFLK